LDVLLEVRHNPKSRKLLSHVKQINHDTLLLASLHERALIHVTPQLLEDLSGNEEHRGTASVYQHFKECFRLHWELYPRRKFPRITSVDALVQYFEVLAEEPQRREPSKATRDLRPFPSPPIPGSDHINALASDDALLKEGQEQHNCAGGYGRMVRDGGCYLYKVRKPERATLRVTLEGKRWYIGELKAICNSPVKPATVRAVCQWLEAHQPKAWG